METILGDFVSLVLNNTELERAAEIANEVAHVAGQIIRKYYSSRVRFVFREKNRDGPVTCVDIEAKEAMVSLITNAFPSPTPFMVRGPTQCNSDNALLLNQFIWGLDLIDGTSSFVGKDMHIWNSS